MAGISTALFTALAVPSAVAAQPAAPPVRYEAPASQVLTQKTLWQENFDALAPTLTPRVNDPAIQPGAIGFTHTPPTGWSVRNGAMSGGVTEWRGWSFTTPSFWKSAEDQQRGWFTRGSGVIAVADSDEFDDVANTGMYDTLLASPPIDVAGQVDLELSFDSHYRQDGVETALVTVSFDGAAPVELMRYDRNASSRNAGGDVISAREIAAVRVPAGARKAVISFSYGGQRNGWFWAIDNVALETALPRLDESAPHSTIHVVSDIQGDLADLGRATTRLNALDPKASALVLNGDLTANGSPAQYTDLKNALAKTPHASGKYIYAIGNHEFFEKSAPSTLVARFLAATGEPSLWDEKVIDGTPVLTIGSESYDYAKNGGSGPFFEMSEAQYSWLSKRLAYWAGQSRPVLLMNHLVLPSTVSGSYTPFYKQQFVTMQQEERFTSLLSKYPNVIMFNSHTHWSLANRDWAVRKSYAGGDPRGFGIVNTGAIQNTYGRSGLTGEALVGGTAENSGVRVHVYADRVRVQGYDFYRDVPFQTIDFPIPVAGNGGPSPLPEVKSYSQEVLADKPTLYWRLGPATGGVAADSAGSNSGAVGSGVTRVADTVLAPVGDIDPASRFAGTIGSTIGSKSQLTSLPQFTHEAWFRTTTTRGGKIVSLGSSVMGQSTGTDRQISMLDNGRITLGAWDSDSRHTLVSSAAYNDGRWHHVAGQIGPTGMKLYVDGAVVATDTAARVADSWPGYLRVGGDFVTAPWPNPPTSHYFAGDIDEVAVYRTALDSARIAAHYAAGRGVG